MNILVIPEDFRNDQYLLKPLFSRLFARIGTQVSGFKMTWHRVVSGIIDVRAAL